MKGFLEDVRKKLKLEKKTMKASMEVIYMRAQYVCDISDQGAKMERKMVSSNQNTMPYFRSHKGPRGSHLLYKWRLR